jgi:hypothetical protein
MPRGILPDPKKSESATTAEAKLTPENATGKAAERPREARPSPGPHPELKSAERDGGRHPGSAPRPARPAARLPTLARMFVPRPKPAVLHTSSKTKEQRAGMDAGSGQSRTTIDLARTEGRRRRNPTSEQTQKGSFRPAAPARRREPAARPSPPPAARKKGAH